MMQLYLLFSKWNVGEIMERERMVQGKIRCNCRPFLKVDWALSHEIDLLNEEEVKKEKLIIVCEYN